MLHLPERFQKKKTDQRIVIPMEQAVDLLRPDEKGKVLTFHQVGDNRVWSRWRRDDLIEAMVHYSELFGGVEISGAIARHHGFGLTIHRGDMVKQLPQSIASKLPLGWLFMQTLEGVCCHCAGKGKVQRQAFQIIGSKCGTCGGSGTYDKPKENPFLEEVRKMEGRRGK